MNYIVEVDKKPDVVEGINLYLDAGWGVESDYVNQKELFGKAYNNSFFITTRVDGKLVGMIRYLTDGFHDTQILECVVEKEFQQKGVAKKMLNSLKGLYSNSAIYLQCTEKYKDAFIKENFRQHKLVGLSYMKMK